MGMFQHLDAIDNMCDGNKALLGYRYYHRITGITITPWLYILPQDHGNYSHFLVIYITTGSRELQSLLGYIYYHRITGITITPWLYILPQDHGNYNQSLVIDFTIG